MGNIIGSPSLFNRIIIEIIIGVLVVVPVNLVFKIFIHVSLMEQIKNSPYAKYEVWILLIASYLLGHLLDKIAFITIDHWAFKKLFQNRSSTFKLPAWCKEVVEKKISKPLDMEPNNSEDLIDDSKTDWISAYFLAKARPEHLSKREDLIANYQFISTIIVVLLLFYWALPVYMFIVVKNNMYTILLSIGVIVSFIGYTLFSQFLLKRIHTFENVIVYGILISELQQGSTTVTENERNNIKESNQNTTQIDCTKIETKTNSNPKQLSKSKSKRC